jgi:DNA-binding NtrC family response regulator
MDVTIEKAKRILIVDDDHDILASLADILDDMGYETVTAIGGAKAISILDNPTSRETCNFDLCLLDFKMPEVDGVQLLKQIRLLHPKLRAIMITAYAGHDGAQRAIAAGSWKVIQKPVDIKMLLETIDEAVT